MAIRILAYLCVALTSVFSALASVNAVGYVNLSLAPGLNLIANPLIPLDPALNQVVAGRQLPEGTEVHFLSSTGYVTARLGIAGEWTPAEAAEIPLVPGDGFFVFNPSDQPVTLTLAGTVPTGSLTNHIPAGFSIQSSIVPQAADSDILKFPAEPGDMIFRYDPERQRYDVYAFDEFDLEWRPSAPTIKVGEAFFVYKVHATDWVRDFDIFAP